MVKPIRITREDLYEQVWATPMRLLAPQYGLSDVRMAQICREAKIPLPWRGYWQQKAAGRAAKVPRLPALSQNAPESVRVLTIVPSRTRSGEDELPAAKRQRQSETKPESRIVVADALHHPHPLVDRTQQILRDAKTDGRGVLYTWPAMPHLAVHVSKGSLTRALRIVDALLKAVEARGWAVELETGDAPATKVRIGVDLVRIRLDERAKRVENARASGTTWLYQRFTFVPTGELTLRIDEYLERRSQISWSDGRQRLEDRLNDVIVGLAAAAEILCERRLRLEEFRAKQEVEGLRRQAARLDEERERARRLDFDRRFSEWVRAGQIRQFVEAVRSALLASGHDVTDSQRWIEWALAYADGIDPLNMMVWLDSLSGFE